MPRGLDLIAMRRLLREACDGITEEELTNPRADELLNLSYWDLESSFPFKEKECRIQFDTTVGENSYLMPDENDAVDLEAIKEVSLLNGEGKTTVLPRMTQSWWDQMYSHNDNQAWGLPTEYLRMDESMILHPTPDAVYTVRVFLWKTLKMLLSGLIDEPDLPREWHEIVVWGAAYRYYLLRQDFDSAAQMKAHVVGMIRTKVPVEAKEENDHYARLNVLRGLPEGGSLFR